MTELITLITNFLTSTASLLTLKSFLIAWFITSYTPIEWVIEWLKPLFAKTRITSLLYNIILLATGCIKCCSFYIGWIIGGFYIGIITSFTAYLYTQIIQSRIEKISFQ